MARGTAEIGPAGSFTLALDLPAGASTGVGWIALDEAEAWGTTHELTIAEYRRPDFEVTTSAGAGPAPARRVDRRDGAGRLLHRRPARRRRRDVAGHDERGDLRPAGLGPLRLRPLDAVVVRGDVFVGDGRAFESEPCCVPADEAKVETFTGRTDAAGAHHLDLRVGDLDADLDGLPVTVRANAAVQDVNRQVIAGTTDLLVHPADLYVGLGGTDTFVRQGEDLTIDVIVTDIDGAAVAGRQVDVVAGRTNGRFVDGEWTDELLDTTTCTVTSAAEPAPCTLTPPAGGTYRITATVTDDAGRVSRSETTRWVSGAEAIPSRTVRGEALTIVPDAEEYRPGQTAQLLVQAPFATGTGLIVTDRGPVTSTATFDVVDGSAIVPVEVGEDDVPNINVSIEVAGSTPRTAADGTVVDGAPAAAGVRHRHGDAARVDGQPDARRHGDPGRRAARPRRGDDARRAGRRHPTARRSPVPTCSSWSSTRRSSPSAATSSTTRRRRSTPPCRPTSPPRTAATASCSSTRRRSSTAPPATATATATTRRPRRPAATATATAAAPASTVADDGRRRRPADVDRCGRRRRGQAVAVRSNFDAVALFAPDVTTDAAGHAAVDLQLPDNLTRYRVMVVAASGTQQFGTGEANVTAELPLMVRPTAPRFLNFGDRVELPVVVQNNDDAPLDADVVVESANLGADVPAGVRVTVPANDRVEVRFPLAAEEVGRGVLRVTAVSGDRADSATVSLPVYTPSTSETFATYGELDGGAIVQPVLAPTDVIPQFGGLEVSTSSTTLQALTDAVLYLTDYRYASSDGLASQLLAISSLRDVLDAFDAPELPSAGEIDVAMDDYIAELTAMQNDDGGFPYWLRGRSSEPFNTIQATHALIVARDAGYAVPADAITRGVDALGVIEQFFDPGARRADEVDAARLRPPRPGAGRAGRPGRGRRRCTTRPATSCRSTRSPGCGR